MADEELKLRITAEAAQAEAALKKTGGGLRDAGLAGHEGNRGLGAFGRGIGALKGQLGGIIAGAVGLAALAKALKSIVDVGVEGQRTLVELARAGNQLRQLLPDITDKEILQGTYATGARRQEFTDAMKVAANLTSTKAEAQQLASVATVYGLSQGAEPALLAKGMGLMARIAPGTSPEQRAAMLAAGAKKAGYDIPQLSQIAPRIFGAAQGIGTAETAMASWDLFTKLAGGPEQASTWTERMYTGALGAPRDESQARFLKAAGIQDADPDYVKLEKMRTYTMKRAGGGGKIAMQRTLMAGGYKEDIILRGLTGIFMNWEEFKGYRTEIQRSGQDTAAVRREMDDYLRTSVIARANREEIRVEAAEAAAATPRLTEMGTVLREAGGGNRFLGVLGVLGGAVASPLEEFVVSEDYAESVNPWGRFWNAMRGKNPRALRDLDKGPGAYNVLDNSTTVIHNNGTQSTTERVTGGSNAIPGPGD